MSLVVIVGLMWLGLLALVVAFCAAAASADRREITLMRTRRVGRAAQRVASTRRQPRSAQTRAAVEERTASGQRSAVGA